MPFSFSFFNKTNVIENLLAITQTTMKNMFSYSSKCPIENVIIEIIVETKMMDLLVY